MNLEKKRKEVVNNIIKQSDNASNIIISKDMAKIIAEIMSKSKSENKDFIELVKQTIYCSISKYYDLVSKHMEYETFFQLSLCSNKSTAIFYFIALNKISIFV